MSPTTEDTTPLRQTPLHQAIFKRPELRDELEDAAHIGPHVLLLSLHGAATALGLGLSAAQLRQAAQQWPRQGPERRQGGGWTADTRATVEPGAARAVLAPLWAGLSASPDERHRIQFITVGAAALLACGAPRNQATLHLLRTLVDEVIARRDAGGAGDSRERIQ